MTLANTLLEKLSSWHPAGEGRHSLACADADTGNTVHLSVDRLETLGVQLWELRVTRSAASLAGDNLDGWAKRIADRVTGLLEPLKVVEIDRPAGLAVLRSEEPARKSDEVFYYEVALNQAGTADVRRYRGARQALRRQQVAFALTREAAAKLVDDLAAK